MATPAVLSRKPKSNLQPTAFVGSPPMVGGAPAVLRVPGSVTAYRDDTGEPVFRYGDRPDGQPETVKVTGPGKPGPTLIGPDGAVSMADEGTAIVGGRDMTTATQNDPNVQAKFDNAYGPSTVSAPGILSPPSFAGSNGGLLPGANGGGTDPGSTILQNQRNVYANQGSAIQAAQAANDAQRGVLGATANTFPYQSAVYDAQGNVINGQQTQNNAQRGYLNSSLQENQQERGALAGIQAASTNVADQSAIARAQNYRDERGYLNRAAGVPLPREINTPNGADQQGLPQGVIGKLQTQGQQLTTAENNRQSLAKLDLAAQAIGVDLKGADVKDLQLIADKAGITLDRAKLLVSEAQNTAGYANLASKNADLNTQRANLTLSESKLPPTSGVSLYTDPVSGATSWLTKSAQDARNAEYERANALTQPGTQLYTDPNTGARSYKTANEITTLNQQNQRNVNNQTAATRYSTTKYGALSEGELMQGVADGSFNPGQAIDELVARGIPLDQAYQQVYTAAARYSYLRGTTVTGQTAASAPKGRSDASLNNPSPNNP